MLAHVLQFVISLDGPPVETVQGLDDYRLLFKQASKIPWLEMGARNAKKEHR